MSMYLTIVVPLYNEEESVEMLLSQLLETCREFEFLCEIILVDDGSTDKTWEIIERLKRATPHLKGIKFRRNYGQTSAMVAGFDHASGEVIVTMDGDLQNDPERIAIFEIGRVYWPVEGQELPEEPRHLCIAMTGPREDRSWLHSDPETFDFFDLKGILDAILVRLNLADTAFAPADHPTFHPGRSATLSAGGEQAGVLGEVHPDVCEAYGLGTQRVCLAELNLEILLATFAQAVQMEPLSLYPAVYEDLAIVVDEQVPAVEVRDLIVQTGGTVLRKAQLFDVYRGDQIGKNKKSLAYALTYQADDKTLTDKAVARLRTKIVRCLERELGATLRG